MVTACSSAILRALTNTKNLTLTQHYTNMYPTANLRYSFSKTSSLRFNYSGRTSQPDVTQLQPVIDNSDPLNVEIGNPDLKQSFTHSFRLLYNSFDKVHFRNMFATVNASFIHNQISSAVITNPQPVLIQSATQILMARIIFLHFLITVFS